MRVKNLVLFVLGLLLAVLAYPVAWVVSVGLAYAMAVLGIVFGGLIVAKRYGKVELILGIMLILISAGSLGLTAMTHAVVSGVQKAVEETLTTKNITATLGERIVAGSWAVTVLKMDTAEYVKEGDKYYSAPNGSKIVVVWLLVENLGKELESPSVIWGFSLVTNAGKGYDRAFVPGDYVWSVTEDVKSRAVEVKSLDFTTKLAPGASAKGCIYFNIPANEVPKELWFKVGIIPGYEVRVKLG